MNRAEQLHDQAEFLRSLARSSSISSKRDQLLRAAEQCDLLADTFGEGRARRDGQGHEAPTEPAAPSVGEPYLRIPGRKH